MKTKYLAEGLQKTMTSCIFLLNASIIHCNDKGKEIEIIFAFARYTFVFLNELDSSLFETVRRN